MSSDNSYENNNNKWVKFLVIYSGIMIILMIIFLILRVYVSFYYGFHLFWVITLWIIGITLAITAILALRFEEKYYTTNPPPSSLIESETKEEKKDLYKIKWDGTVYDLSPKFKCPICEHENPRDAKMCKFCKNEFQTCKICGKNLGKDEVVYCPNCNAEFHKEEFLEWLKVRAHCKICNIEIDLWEFQKYLKEQNLHQLESKMCLKCGKKIPVDAKFCISCGVKIN